MTPRLDYGRCPCGKPLTYAATEYCSPECWRKATEGEPVQALTDDVEPMTRSERDNRTGAHNDRRA